MKTPSFKGKHAASPRAASAARGSSKKRDTRCEVVLRKELWAAGLRYRKDVASLSGRPDVVFRAAKVVVFCDGDFWHGRGWSERKSKLQAGHNASYWVAKIERNMQRDREHTAALEGEGWLVLRIWEGEILRDPQQAVRLIEAALRSSEKRRLPRKR